MKELIDQIPDRYKDVGLLGKGGMGAVYKAYDITLQLDVAIKVMHPDYARQSSFQDRFLQEARAAVRLQHPGIVRVFDIAQARSLVYIVMEFIPGDNLRVLLQRLKTQGKLFVLDEAVHLVRQVCLALDYAHRQEVLHRDIKPDNIMLKDEPCNGLPYRPVITDLGLAKLAQDQSITQVGVGMGTPAYVSPEQAQGLPTDARSDVYSLGVVLYELVAGHPPFPARNIREAIRYHKEDPPPPRSQRPDMPEHLEQVILRALARDPDDRLTNAAMLAQALTLTIPATTRAAYASTAPENAVSLTVPYQESLFKERGLSVMDDFSTPSPDHTQDTIQIMAPGQPDRFLTMRAGGLTIGRADDNDLVLDDPKVSRHHARVEYVGRDCHVVDLGSTNRARLANRELLPGLSAVWASDIPLRIGDTHLRLLHGQQPDGSDLYRSDGTRVEPILIHASDRLYVVVEPERLAVEPGSSVSATLIIRNRGTVVDQFEVSVDGIPADWVPSPPPLVKLMPGGQQEVSLTIQPPRSPQSRAGEYPLVVRVTSRDDPGQEVRVRAVLTVAVYHQFSSELYPERPRAGQSVRVTVRNQGNIRDAFNLSWRDRAAELAFEPPYARLTVAEGEAAVAEFRAVPRQRRWVGGEKAHPFTAQVSPAQGASRCHGGEVVSKPLIPGWMPPLIIAPLIALCLVIGYLAVKPAGPSMPVLEEWVVFPTQVTQGQSVTIKWHVSNAESVTLQPFGTVNNAGEIDDAPLQTRMYTLIATNKGKTLQKSQEVVVVTPLSAPKVKAFIADPSTLVKGQVETVRLTWDTEGADTVTIEPDVGPVGLGGSLDAPAPSENITYTLIAKNETDETRVQAYIVVIPPEAPTIKVFTVEPGTLVIGAVDTVSLNWDTEGADGVTIEPGIGPVALTGSLDVPAPSKDTTYTLIASNEGGEARAEAQVAAILPEAPVVEFSVEPDTFVADTVNTVRLTWRTERADTVTIEPHIGDVELTGSLDVSAPLEDAVYTLVAENAGGETRKQVQVNVEPFAVTSVTADVDPSEYTGECPTEFNFSAIITVNGPGTVKYTWERSDGATAAVESITFDAAGSKTVADRWRLGGSGSRWERIRILAPNEMVSNNANLSLTCDSARVAYIYTTDLTTANNFQTLLESNGFLVDLIPQGAILSTNFGSYDCILIGYETGKFSTWRTNPWGDAEGRQAGHIAASGHPVLGLGEGGNLFFQAIGLSHINNGNSMTITSSAVYVVDATHPVWSSPNPISVPGNRLVTLYRDSGWSDSIHYPSSKTGVTPIGRDPDRFPSHYHIIMQDGKFLLWGFSGDSSAMTATGQQVFINVLSSLLP